MVARSVHLGEGKLQITEEVRVCVCVDEGGAVRCHRAISGAVTVVGMGHAICSTRGRQVESQLSQQKKRIHY